MKKKATGEEGVIAKLKAQLEDIKREKQDNFLNRVPTEGWHEIGFVAVDSGQLMVGDPCYFTDDGWTQKDYDYWTCPVPEYEQTIKIPYSKGHEGKGIAFLTPGDGEYRVFARFKKVHEYFNGIAEIRIVLTDSDVEELNDGEGTD